MKKIEMNNCNVLNCYANASRNNKERRIRENAAFVIEKVLFPMMTVAAKRGDMKLEIPSRVWDRFPSARVLNQIVRDLEERGFVLKAKKAVMVIAWPERKREVPDELYKSSYDLFCDTHTGVTEEQYIKYYAQK